MSTYNKERWDERYSTPDFAYGTEPNEYLRSQLQKFEPGKILFPAEGEGRNAVFAAKSGWDVSAFDQSSEGKRKALLLAENNNVTIDYKVGDLSDITFKNEEFDAIAFIFAHFPAEIKAAYHKTLANSLKTGGIIIFEAFSKKHLDYVLSNPNVGGPKDIDTLFSIEEIQTDFPGYEVIELRETAVELNEGLYHKGKGSVIRFTGRKK